MIHDSKFSTLKYFDAHGHPNFAVYKDDRDEVIRRALDAGVWMNVVGTQQDTSKDAVALAEKYPEGVFATIGLHPIHTDKSYYDKEELGEEGKEFTSRGELYDISYYRELAKSPKVVAVGECGLDYYKHDANTRMETNDTNKKQEENFRKQIELANEIKKPLMLHLRSGKIKNAYREAFEILKEKAKGPMNLHFFAGNISDAERFLDLGAHFSFGGVLTITRDYDEVVRKLPLDKILAETDCPYVTPMPHRGKRNEPLYVIETVKKIAEIRGADFEKVRAALLQNSLDFFSLKV